MNRAPARGYDLTVVTRESQTIRRTSDWLLTAAARSGELP
jgi:hypothetical protein